jgi:hypothetical protein
MSSTGTGTASSRAAGRDRVDRTVRDLTVGTSLAALVATGVVVGAVVPHQTSAGPAVQQLQQQPDDDDRSPSFSGSGSTARSGGGQAPVVSSGAS